MGWQLHWIPVLMGISSIVSFGVASVVWNGRDRAGATPLFVLLVAAGWWSLMSCIGYASTDVGIKLAAHNGAYLGIAAVPIAWLVFAIDYTGQLRRPRLGELGLLSVIPVITAALAMTDPLHGYFRSSAVPVETGTILVMETTPTTWFWFWSAYAYVLFLVGAVLLVKRAVDSMTLFRDQVILVIVATMLPLTGNVLYLTGLTAPFDFTSSLFTVSGILLAVAIFRRQLLSFVPTSWIQARDELISTMQDAVIVTDSSARIAYANPAADALARDPGMLETGQSLEAVFPGLAAEVSEAITEPVRRECSGIGRFDDRHYELQVTPLTRTSRTPAGQLITLRDVTERIDREKELKRRGEALQVLNRVLRHDIRNEIQVILLHLDQLVDGQSIDETDLDPLKERCHQIVELGEKARTAEAALRADRVPREKLDVAVTFEEIVSSLAAAQKGIHLSVDSRIDGPFVTSRLIPMAVTHIVENAVIHHGGTNPTIEITVSQRDDSLVVRVADDGPGMPPMERTVFESAAETPLEHSNGLGLWLVRWVVEDAKGGLEIADNKPSGTIVTMTLPNLAGSVDESPEVAISDDHR